MRGKILATLFVALGQALAVAGARASDLPNLKVEIYRPDLVYPGTTAYMDAADFVRPRIFEIDFEGHVLWAYTPPASWVGEKHESNDFDWLPNDHFLMALDFGGIIEVDRAKNIVWSYRVVKISHDVDRLPNGNTLFTFGFDQDDDAQVTEIDPNGKVVWEWYARKALPKDFARTTGRKDAKDVAIKSRASGAGRASGVATNIAGQGFTHTNGATRLPNGNTVISLRNLGRIVEVNPAGEVVWSFDRANGTHAPEVMANGNILINHSGGSKLTEITRSGDVVWHFDVERYGRGNRYAHRLPNGNTLVVTQNRLLEVTPSGEVAWLVRELDIPDEGSRREGPTYTSFDKDQRSLYGAGRIPLRDSPEWGQWWDDPAKRPPMNRPAMAARAPAGDAGAAHPGRPSGDSLFEHFDTNGDGKVSDAEFLAVRRNNFQAMDDNHDGMISREEFDAHVPPGMPPQMRTMIFAHVDVNGDGKLSTDEIDAASREVFHILHARVEGRPELQSADLTAQDFAAKNLPPPILMFGVPPGGVRGPATAGGPGPGGGGPQQRRMGPPGR